ncbi:MAG: aldo/keto reductase, partial [Acidobacteria bacterium]|nr:aldo/keto reductase [Acidobacteriota bacterium]
MERRDFLKRAVASPASAQLIAAGRQIPKRTYRDNVKLSVIAFGGIVVVGMEQKDADREVAASVDRGIN